jgi:small-conductance mechanosensitive channel
MKLQQWFIAWIFLALAVAGLASFVLTGDYGNSPLKTSAAASAEPELVDTSLLSTARDLSQLAASPEEQKLSGEAVRVADHEVDLAFADALREAREHTSENDPKYRELNARIHDAQATVDDDKAQLAQLKAKLATARPAELEGLQAQIALLEAQQTPDEDELEVAKDELVRAGGDREGAVERQREAHEASEEHLAQNSTTSQRPPLDLNGPSLAGHIRAWFWRHSQLARLEAAQRQVQELGKTVQGQRDAVEQHLKAEAPRRQESRQQAVGLRAQRARGAVSSDAVAAAVASFKRGSNDQKLLSGYSKQWQDAQELTGVYNNWIALATSGRRSALHAMLRSLLWILLIAFLAFVAGCAVDRFFTHATAENKHLLTVRSVLRFALQAVAVLLVALVVFGTPNQMPTVLGLAGAGLTVALKDFIVGFFGWFVLMGRNGIRVGDWVEINGVVGEVTEIGLLRTVLLETGNWTDTGHPTGRKVAFVNSFAIEGHYFNFSTTGQWLWDELQVTIPPGEDPCPLVESIQKLMLEETRANAAQAEKEWQKAAGQRLQSLSVAPAIQLRPTGTAVEVQVRYITSANERFMMRARMYEKIVALMHAQSQASA